MSKLKNYAEVVSAFAGGKDIQVYSPGFGWTTWEGVGPPTYKEWDDFQVKLSPTRYRIVILETEGIQYPHIHSENSMCEGEADFVRWHGDWFEV